MRAARHPIAWTLICCTIAALVSAGLVAPARAATEVLYVAQTGHYVRGVFRDFWDRNGGLANFGYPITEEYLEPGSGRVLQYFERARFERAAAGATVVQLGALGREALAGRTFPAARPITNSATRRFIPETQQVIQYGFKEIWETRGGQPIFGLPLSGEIVEPTDDGRSRTVQWFERARFEYHPELPAGQRVLISALGRRLAPTELTAPLAPNAPPPAPLSVSPSQAAQPSPTAGIARPVAAPAVNATIAPLAGSPGQTFTLSPTNGFIAGETVSVWANAKGQAPQFVGRFRATSDGGLAPVRFTPAANAALGEWAIVAEGNESRRQAVGYFTLISGAIGRNPATPVPPTPTPGPPVPRNVDAAAEPASGPAGTVFFFDAFGFQAGEEVQVAVIAPDGRQTGGDPVTADERGSLRYAGLFYPTAAGAPLGLYRMVAYGRASNKTSTAYFVLTP